MFNSLTPSGIKFKIIIMCLYYGVIYIIYDPSYLISEAKI